MVGLQHAGVIVQDGQVVASVAEERTGKVSGKNILMRDMGNDMKKIIYNLFKTNKKHSYVD